MGYLYACFAFLVWGVVSTVVLRAIPLPGPCASDAGCLFGTLVVLGVMGRRRWPEIGRALRAYPLRIAGLASAFAGCSATYQWAVKTTTVANAVLAHSLQPFLTCLLFVPLWGGPKPTAKGWLALAAGIAGLGIVLAPQLSWDAPLAGVGLAAASAVFFSWYNVQVAFFRGKVPQHALHACVGLLAGAMLLPAWLFAGPIALTPIGAVALVTFGVMAFGVANMCYLKALSLAPVGHVGTLAYLEPVVSIAAAVAFLHEPLSGGVLAGGVLILASGALVVFDRPPAP